VGLGIMSFSLITPQEWPVLKIFQFFLFGTVNSMQFTAMNTLTMKDLEKGKSGDGNSLFSMVQMLAMSLSVAAAGSLLSAFLGRYQKLEAFHLTFLCMGIVTCVSAWIFFQVGSEEKTSQKKLESLVNEEI
jgi:hypothetical protein